MKHLSSFLFGFCLCLSSLIGQNAYFLPLGEGQQPGIDSLNRLGVATAQLQVYPTEVIYAHHGATFLYQYSATKELQAICMNRRFDKWGPTQDAMNSCLTYFRGLRIQEVTNHASGQSRHYVWLDTSLNQRFEMKVLPLGKRQFLIQLSRRQASEVQLANQ
ncbi:MAG: hypothetical protein AAF399_26720 [Bacteroidota bacterium]